MWCHAQYLSGQLAEEGAFATQEQGKHQMVRTLRVVYAFYQYYWLLFSSPFAILLNCSHPSSWVFASFSFFFSSPPHRGAGRSERVIAWFFVANWSKITTVLSTQHGAQTHDLGIISTTQLLVKINSIPDEPRTDAQWRVDQWYLTWRQPSLSRAPHTITWTSVDTYMTIYVFMGQIQCFTIANDARSSACTA